MLESYALFLFLQEASDKRMKEINESLQGIKLLKLRGWEDKFYEKISISRDAELNYLNKDSLYWALMSVFLSQFFVIKYTSMV